MNKSDCFELGYLTKPYGLDGELVAVFDVDDLTPYEDLKMVFVDIKDNLVPYEVEWLEFMDKKIIIKLDGIDTVEQANLLKGKTLYLPLSQLPPLEEGQFYYHDIIGYQVHDETKGILGKIKLVYTLQVQDLIAVDHNGVEIMIPVNDVFILRVDHQARTMYTRLPEGLVEVYLQP
ncbi:MAG: ribosome maturation factor RimM [Cytophagales bacterium]|nr:ribosome maturation factor RimM [Bernardetiaceae bacterium]MDW8211365.1 ribosome maturation factor RimM [Cytophagales bacterium]